MPATAARVLAFSCFLSLTFACNTGKKIAAATSNPHFHLLDIYSEDWADGRKSGTTGTDYHLQVVIKTDHLGFSKLILPNPRITLPLSVSRMRGPVTNYPVTYVKGDTLLLLATYSPLAGEKVSNNPADTSEPSMIEYQTGDKIRYATLPLIRKKEGPARPQ